MTKYQIVNHRIEDIKRLLQLYKTAGISPESPTIKDAEYKLNCLYYYIGLVK